MKNVYILLMIISTFACNEILMAQNYHYPVPPDGYNKQARVDYMIEQYLIFFTFLTQEDIIDVV